MDLVGNPFPSGFTKTIFREFDTSPFKTPVLGTLGTVGRNTIRGPGQRAVDLSLFKNFRVQERFEVQFRAEAFNLIASPYYTNIYPGYNASATAGTEGIFSIREFTRWRCVSCSDASRP